MSAAAVGDDRLLSFTVGGQVFALPAAAVSEVVRRPRVTRVPQAPAGLVGVANVRGRVLPVIALAELLQTPGAGSADGRLIIVEHPEPMALAVDAVSRFGASADGARPLDLERLVARGFGARTPRAARVARPQAPAAAAAGDSAEARRPILRFELSGQAYGLPLEAVREVRDASPEILNLSVGDAAVAGVVEHRGRLLPVVRPAQLLGLPAASNPGRGRIVVMALGGASLGLIVERVDDIVRVEPDRIAAAPAILNRGEGEARIAAVARTAHGLVALISPERLFRDDTVAAILHEQHEESAPMAAAAAASEQLLIFRLGEETYALPIDAVDEVVRYPQAITRAPRAPAFLAGVANHRGEALPIVDQRVRFATPGEAPAKGRRVIVTRIAGMRVGFAVDAVEALRAVAAEDLSETPELAAGEGLFDRVVSIEVDGRLVLLVNPRELLDQAERDLVAAVTERK